MPAPSPRQHPLPPRLHVVTGKGGTGKTTVATALALALAGRGRRVLLCEVEGRQGVARLLGTDPLPPRETEVAEGVGGGSVVALAVEPRSALMLYLDTFYHLGRAGSALEKVGAVDFITSVAPGLRDILLVGMVYEAVRRAPRSGAGSGGRKAGDDASGYAYDAVVLDAPPTGRIGKFLGIGSELSGLAGGGPIAGQAASVAELLRSPATAVHLVSLLEELPVTETCEAADELAAAGLRLGAVVANRVLADPGASRGRTGLPGGVGGGTDGPGGADGPDAAEAVVAALEGTEVLRRAGSDAWEVADALLAQGEARARAVGEQRVQRATLERAGRPVVDLPVLGGGVDVSRLYQLADLVARAPALTGAAPSGATAPSGAAGVAP